jgi:hypothetical protein
MLRTILPMGDKISIYILFTNALINTFLLARFNQKISKRETQAYSRNFWQGYLFFVPFFVTISIVKELDKKNKLKFEILMKNSIKVTNSWKLAASDLNILIQAPFIVSINEKTTTFPVLIEHFGNKMGTVIFLKDDKLNLELIKALGYYYSIVNPNAYSKYDRDFFIETLNDWGFYGDELNKPTWYTGKPWS